MAARTPGIGPDDGCLVQCTTSGRSPSITNGFGVRSTRPLLRAALTCVDASTPDQSPRAAAADTHVAVALACTARSTYLWHFFVKYQSRFARRTSSRSIARSRSMGRTPASRSCLRCAMPSDPITATTSMLTSWRRYLDRLDADGGCGAQPAQDRGGEEESAPPRYPNAGFVTEDIRGSGGHMQSGASYRSTVVLPDAGASARFDRASTTDATGAAYANSTTSSSSTGESSGSTATPTAERA